MSTSAAQATHFFNEIAAHKCVWAIRDDGGFPVPMNRSGERAMPFWSLESRARKIIATVPAYKDFSTERLSLQEFTENWLPGLEQDALLVGINWSGDRATGYDMEPKEVLARLAAVTG